MTARWAGILRWLGGKGYTKMRVRDIRLRAKVWAGRNRLCVVTKTGGFKVTCIPRKKNNICVTRARSCSDMRDRCRTNKYFVNVHILCSKHTL